MGVTLTTGQATAVVTDRNSRGDGSSFPSPSRFSLVVGLYDLVSLFLPYQRRRQVPQPGGDGTSANVSLSLSSILTPSRSLPLMVALATAGTAFPLAGAVTLSLPSQIFCSCEFSMLGVVLLGERTAEAMFGLALGGREALSSVLNVALFVWLFFLL
ncbi:hypothetical protein PIB30_057981 [Stylosanthes scabra]|uniref:Sodium/calcium exchanger membrane region domain-containing protein n=1 Tax=Stylosanthes scabra TaxID=79078 RepID=A0ABU6TJN4_9FABA|nr:hypothetical protein [Stylosanthes scabra]